MSQPNDLNAKYEPAAYPRMLYSTPDTYLIVQSAAEEAKARAAGYTDFHLVDPTRDGLENRSKEHLIDIALEHMRTKLLASDPEDIIAGIRQMREAEAARPERDPGAEPDFDAMSDDGLRAFLVSSGAEPAHHRAGRPKLLELARAAHEAGANAAAE